MVRSGWGGTFCPTPLVWVGKNFLPLWFGCFLVGDIFSPTTFQGDILSFCRHPSKLNPLKSALIQGSGRSHPFNTNVFDG
jgi:hypothetical protein